MEVHVRGKHFHVPEHVEERAREKLSRLNHHLPLLDDGICEVDVSHEKSKTPEQRFYVHVNVSAHGVHLHATGHAEDPDAAVDHAVHVLTRQADRKKSKLYDRGRQAQPELAAPPEQVEEELSDRSHPSLGRVKRYPMKPMSVAEATEQLEALGHDFFVFHHDMEEKVAVLYRRRAGDYGMILPELP